MSHTVGIAVLPEHFDGGTRDGYLARCTCRQQSVVFRQKWQAQDWELAHNTEIERIRALLNQRQPSLRDQRDWFAYKADDPETPDDDRPLWRQLADEITRRLNDDHVPSTPEPLF